VSIVLESAPPAGPVTLGVPPDADGVARVALRELRPGRRHRYRILTGDGRTAEGEFVTAPAPDEAAPVRLLWSGDLGARRHCAERPYGVFTAMARRRPDLFLFVGDTVYADHRCPGVAGAERAARTRPEFRARYLHNLGDAAVQGLLRRTSVTAIWDDHEVRGNFSGPTEPLTPVGRAAFLDAWPVATPPGEPTRLHRRRRWGALLEIFVLDTRQYRSANRRPDGPHKTMLGAAQRRWLVEAVAASPALWKVVVSSVPLSLPKGWPVSDSWAPRSVLGYRTGFARERDEILARLRAAGVRNLVVLAADVHFATAIAHAPAPGFRLWELVAGPLAAGTKDPWPPAAGLGSRVLFAHGGQPTFGELGVGVDALDVRFYGGDGALLWEHRLPAALPGRAG
jgi:alkaline phosphatase D